MPHPSYSILYVADPQASAPLYAELLDAQPVDASPTFVLFALEGGKMLGLWTRAAVQPPVSQDAASTSELAFRVADTGAVDALHDAWRARGLAILQAPQQVDFGYTFLAADPDGHRLRAFARNE